MQTEKYIFDLVELGSSVKIGASLLRWSNGTTREFFANLEFICFLLMKFEIPSLKSSYNLRSHKRFDRIALLKKYQILDNEISDLLTTMFKVRNAYFHSTLDFAQIEYQGGRLKHTWKQFESDSLKVSEDLTAKFLKIQYLQVSPLYH